MNIRDLAIEKGFAEGVDFSFDGENITLLEKITIVHHDAIPGAADESGTVLAETQPAYDEEIKYFAPLPSIDSLKRECLKRVDTGYLVGKYLESKTHVQGDLNLDLFLSGGDGWRITNVQAPSIDELYSQIARIDADKTQTNINSEAQAYLDATDWMVIRFSETGTPYPDEVKLKRIEMRDKIQKV